MGVTLALVCPWWWSLLMLHRPGWLDAPPVSGPVPLLGLKALKLAKLLMAAGAARPARWRASTWEQLRGPPAQGPRAVL